MRFELSEDEDLLAGLARDFVSRRVAAAAGAWDAAGAIPAADLAALDALGLAGVCAPEAVGGAGLDPVALVVILELLAAGSASLAARLGVQAGPAVAALAAAPSLAPSLSRVLSGAQRAAWLGRLERTGDRITGRGAAVVAAADADLFVGVVGYAGVVALPAREVRLTPLSSPLSLRAAGRADVTVDSPAAQLSQADPAGVAEACRRAILVDAAVALGAGQGALDASLPYALARTQFGKPIADFQAIQWMIADSATELDAARLLLLQAAAGEGSALQARLLTGTAARRAADRCLQMHGGYGYTLEYSVSRHFRDAHHALLAAGPDGGRAAIAQEARSGS